MCLFVSVEFFYLRTEPRYVGFPGGPGGEQSTSQCRKLRDAVPSWGQEDPLEEGRATHPSILARRIPWTEDPGGPQSMGSPRVNTTEATERAEPQRCSQEGRGALSRNWRTPVSACSAMLYVSGCRTCRLLGLVASAFAEPGMFFARHGG